MPRPLSTRVAGRLQEEEGPGALGGGEGVQAAEEGGGSEMDLEPIYCAEQVRLAPPGRRGGGGPARRNPPRPPEARRSCLLVPGAPDVTAGEGGRRGPPRPPAAPGPAPRSPPPARPASAQARRPDVSTT